MIGETVSHYRILEKLGSGGMGDVYRAEDTRLRRIVALKFLSPQLTLDEDARTRFIHEAQAASALQHHNICTIHEIDRTADGRMFICMDYYTGGTLKQRIGGGPMRVAEAVDLAAQIAAGLSRAHAAGTVHRDIKPANVAVTEDGEVKILDFGLAVLSDRTRVTKAGTTVGTVAYMSPENARGEDVGPAADVWSLGVILYEMLTGRLPFRADHEAAVLYSLMNESHDPVGAGREDIPAALERIVDRALSKDPADRYADAGEMKRDLRGLAGSPDADTPAAARPALRRPRLSHYWIPAAAIAVIAVAILLLKPLMFAEDVVSAPRPVAVISFENATGDPEFDYLCDVIPNLLITSLEQSKYLSVVTWERMHDLLARTGHTGVDRIDRQAGFEACRIDGINTIVLGSFTKAGEVFVTDVKVLDVQSKELLKSTSAKGEGVGSILDSQVDELGEEIARGVGLSERRIAAGGGQPIAAVTTGSLDAYDYFIRGREKWRKKYWAEAADDFRRSVEVDSTFAIAWLYLGKAHDNAGEMKLKDVAYEKANTYAASAPEKDRLYIEAMYARSVRKDDDSYQRLLLELISRYPKEKQPFVDLGGFYREKHNFNRAEEYFQKALRLDPLYDNALNAIAYLYAAQGDHEKAIEYFERNARAHPDVPNPLDSMGEIYFRVGRLEESVEAYERALEIKPDYSSARCIAYVKALQEDWEAAFGQLQRYINGQSGRGQKAVGGYLLASIYATGGRWQDALDVLSDATRTLESLGHHWGVAETKWIEAWVRYAYGDFEGSRDCVAGMQAETALAGERVAWGQLTGEILLGLADLEEDRVDRAAARVAVVDSLLAPVASSEPELSELTEWSAAVYRAEVLLAQGRVDDAIAAGRSLPRVKIPTFHYLNTIYYNFPQNGDVLARAYVRKGAVEDAIAEYERLVTFDPESDERRLINPLFHYRLGVLYEQNGRGGEAVQQYEKFLEICGDAEPPMDEVNAARRRVAALES